MLMNFKIFLLKDQMYACRMSFLSSKKLVYFCSRFCITSLQETKSSYKIQHFNFLNIFIVIIKYW